MTDAYEEPPRLRFEVGGVQWYITRPAPGTVYVYNDRGKLYRGASFSDLADPYSGALPDADVVATARRVGDAP